MCTEPLTPDMTNKSLKCNLKYSLITVLFYFFRHLRHSICTPLQDTMQHAAWTFHPSDIPWILQKLLFSHTSFCTPLQDTMQHAAWTFDPSDIPWILQKLIFPIIYQIAHLHNWPTWPNYLFDLCWQLSWMTCLAILEGILRLFSQLALKFHWVKTYFFQHLWHYKLHLNRSVMPKPVSLLTA